MAGNIQTSASTIANAPAINFGSAVSSPAPVKTTAATPAYNPPKVKLGGHSFVPALTIAQMQAELAGAKTTLQGDQAKLNTPATPPANTPPAFIPALPNSAMPPGFTATTTPQGGTAAADPQGNIYTQNGSGWQLQTSLPAQNGKTTTYSTPGGPVSSQYVAGAAAGPGATGPGSGQETSDITATSSANAQNPGTVAVGPGAPAPTVSQSAPTFNAGGVANPVDLGDVSTVASGLSSLSEGLDSGSIDSTTVTDAIGNLNSSISDAITSATATSGAAPGTTYNLDPSEVAGGDPNILSAITSDPATFAAFNQQFGVPQLQQQYLQALNVTGGITTAVAKLTEDIQNDNNIPTWLATRQISFLSNKASELMAPFTAQANTIKAQLSYATANMKAYYSQYATGQRLTTAATNSANTQLNRVLKAGGIDPNDTAAIAQWSTQTGIPADQIAVAAKTQNLLLQLNVSGKETTQAANAELSSLLNDPSYINTMAQGLVSGAITPDVMMQLTGRGTIGSAITGAVVSQAQSIAEASGNPNGVNFQAEVNDATYAANATTKQRVQSAQSIQSLIPAFQTLATSANLSQFPTINDLIQNTGIQFGGVTYNNFDQFATAVQNDLSVVLGVSGQTDQTRAMAQQFANPDQSPQQFASSLKQLQTIMDANTASIASQAGTQAASLNLNSDGTPITAPGSSGVSASNPFGL